MVYVKYYFELKTLKNQSLAFSIVVWKRQNEAPGGRWLHTKDASLLYRILESIQSLFLQSIFDQKYQINQNLKVGIK